MLGRITTNIPLHTTQLRALRTVSSHVGFNLQRNVIPTNEWKRKEQFNSSRIMITPPIQFVSFSTNEDKKTSTNVNTKTMDQLIQENLALQKKVDELNEQLKKKPGKMLQVISQYGLPFFLWWSTLYVSTGVGLYIALENGWIGGTDAIDLIQSLGLDKYIEVDRLNPSYGNMALAFLCNELVEPIRFPLSLATIPTIKRLLSKSSKKEDKA